MDSIIELRKVDKVYKGGVDTQVLFAVDLAFERGSFSSLIGQSGSGKSTLLNILGTLDRPTRGDVMVDGKATGAMRPRELARLRNKYMGFVFQFHHLLPEFTALENVMMPALIGGRRPDAKLRAGAEGLLEMVGLGAVKNNPSTKMSGGQQQRTAIARALMNEPAILLADEPTGNLDSETSKDVFSLLRDLNRRLRTTVVIVTHDRRIAEQTDRIVEIRDGRIHMDISK